MTSKLTVYTDAGEKRILLPVDHLATGGEGSVYAKDGVIYKVYLDPAKAQRAKVPEKLQLLRKFKHPGIAAPTGSLMDKKGEFLGLTLAQVRGEALTRLYTSVWQTANQFGPDECRKVTLAMREVMAYAHAHQALMVDANELNWLVDGVKPCAIDVDSWQLPGFSATAIMPSIRDPLATAGFTPGSDWFAWAVVTFQLWVGIHPYKGTHPDFARAAMDARMKAGVSVFDGQVRLPGAARELAAIPSALKTWYHDVFQQGLRSPPPAHLTGAPATQTAPKLRVVQTANAYLKQVRLASPGGKVLAAFSGFAVIKTGAALVLWDTQPKAVAPWASSADCEAVLAHTAAVVRLPQGPALIRLSPGKELVLRQEGGDAPLVIPTRARQLWQSGARVFALVEGVPNGMVELMASALGDRVLLTAGSAWPVTAQATRFLRGCFVQDCLGVPFVGVLVGAGLVQYKAPALRGYQVIDGLGLDASNVWLTALRKADGETVRLRLELAQDTFIVGDEAVVPTADLDGALLSSGVGVVRLGDDLRVSKGAHRKDVADCRLSASARLFSLGATLGLVDGHELSQLSLG